jgi:hypothetical protein
MVAATLLWGATFVVVRDSLGRLAPAAIVATRFGIAAVLLGMVALVRRHPVDRATLAGGALTGVLTAGSYAFQAVGLTATSAGTSAFLTAAGTLLAGLFAWPLLGQRPGARLTLGLLLAAAGSALLSLRGARHVGPGEAWTLFGAAIYALQVVGVSRWSPRVDPVALTAVQAVTVVACTLPFAGDLAGALRADRLSGRVRERPGPAAPGDGAADAPGRSGRAAVRARTGVRARLRRHPRRRALRRALVGGRRPHRGGDRRGGVARGAGRRGHDSASHSLKRVMIFGSRRNNVA